MTPDTLINIFDSNALWLSSSSLILVMAVVCDYPYDGSRGSIRIYDCDVATLNEATWLNDQIIGMSWSIQFFWIISFYLDFFMKYFHGQMSVDNKNTVHIFASWLVVKKTNERDLCLMKFQRSSTVEWGNFLTEFSMEFIIEEGFKYNIFLEGFRDYS